MTVVIKRGMDVATIRKLIQPLLEQQTKAGNIRDFCGVVKLKGDPIKLQEKWRNEWS